MRNRHRRSLGERLPNVRWERINGAIKELYVPFDTWEALQREGVTARKGRDPDQIHTLPDIGRKIA